MIRFFFPRFPDHTTGAQAVLIRYSKAISLILLEPRTRNSALSAKTHIYYLSRQHGRYMMPETSGAMEY